jgi:hypothetical protein
MTRRIDTVKLWRTPPTFPQLVSTTVVGVSVCWYGG